MALVTLHIILVSFYPLKVKLFYSLKLKFSFFLDLISQTWLTPNDSDSSIWRHWVTICVPYEIKHNTAFMYIDGGRKYISFFSIKKKKF